MNKLIAIVFALLLLQGCQLKPQQVESIESTSPQAATNGAIADPPPIRYDNFPTETLYSLLVAEVAASRGRFDITLHNYIEEARNTNNTGVIARAARIAQFLRSQQNATDMGLLWLQHEPNNTEAISLVTNAYLELGKPLKALAYAEKALLQASGSDTPERLQKQKNSAALTETIANLSKQANAETISTLILRFQQLINTYPQLTSLKVGLSTLYQTSGDINNAFHWVHQALKQEPTLTSAVIKEVQLLQQNQEDEQAISKLEALLERYPDNSRLRLIYARLLTKTDIEKAYQQFTQLSKQSPRQLDLKFSRALLATELKEIEVAQALMQELLTINYRPNTLRFYLGHIAELSQQPASALDYYLSVTAGEDLLASRNRAGRIMIQQGNVDQAQALFAELRHSHPDKKEALFEAESNLLIANQSLAPALRLLNLGINEFPDNPKLRYNRSTIYEKQDKLELMESDLRYILAIDPKNVNALNGLGYFLTTRTTRYEEAEQLIKQAFELRPEDASIIDSMGWVAFKRGRIEEAIALLQKAFELYPDPEIAAHLGEALWVNKQHQAAKKLLRENLKDNPDTPYILDILKRLDISL